MQPTAAAAFESHANSIREHLARIELALTDCEDAFKDSGESNWGFPGTLAHNLEALASMFPEVTLDDVDERAGDFCPECDLAHGCAPSCPMND